LLALRRRRQTGRGTLIDVAMRDTGLWMLTNAYQYWDLARTNLRRRGSAYIVGDVTRSLPSVFACRDGYVVWMPLAGRLAHGTARLVAWMAEEGAAPDWLQAIVWEDFELLSQAEIDRFLAPFIAFFAGRTRAELLDAALKHGIMLAPVNAIADLLADPQLAARGAWVAHTLDGRDTLLPRAPVRISGVDWSPAQSEPPSAPRSGEGVKRTGREMGQRMPIFGP
jgi:benzylsuccinate CoA-transferase BbsE subunit